MKSLSKVFIFVLAIFLNACSTQATPDVNSIAQTSAAMVWTAAAQTMEAIPTETPFPTATQVPTPTPTETPLAPLNYTIIESNENCATLAEKFEISIYSIRMLNGWDNICINISEPLPVGLVIKIPLPTPTIPPPP